MCIIGDQQYDTIISLSFFFIYSYFIYIFVLGEVFLVSFLFSYIYSSYALYGLFIYMFNYFFNPIFVIFIQFAYLSR